jgi:hypothetical protein
MGASGLDFGTWESMNTRYFFILSEAWNFSCRISSHFPRGGRKAVQERLKIMAREQLAKSPSGD